MYLGFVHRTKVDNYIKPKLMKISSIYYPQFEPHNKLKKITIDI